MYLLALLSLLVLGGCESPVTVGWDPATMRCRTWQDGVPVGHFLKDEACAGIAKPIEEEN